MPSTLQNKIKAIDAEVVRLHYKWKHCKQVFGSDKKVKLLNEAAPRFFGYLWNLMLFDIVLSIARLTDPPKTRVKSINKENLSFDNLMLEIKDASLRSQVSQQILALKMKMKAVKTWRDETIAHKDLLRQMKEIPLPTIQVSEITDALALIRGIMNVFHRQFNSQTVVYEICFKHDPGDGKSLMYYLKYGFDAFKEDCSRPDIWSRRDHEITKWLED